MKKKTTVFHRIVATALCCCMMLGACPVGLSAAATSAQMGTYISKTYEYEKGSAAKVLTDAEAKTALSENTDLLILAAGRDVGRSSVTDDEFSTYLGYVNANLRSGNGNYTAMDFLRGALAVRAAGADPTQVGKDANGNSVNLLYKGLYTRSIGTLEKEGTKTVAYGLLALDANGIADAAIRSAGSKVSRSQLKNSLVASAYSLSTQSSPDVGTSAMLLAALAPYYQIGEADVVSASRALLYKMAELQGSTGLVKSSTAATANLITALCSMGIDPAQNEYFTYDLHQGLMGCYNSDGGFTAGSGAASSVDATAVARCALVAYYCFDRGEDFYDFTHVKAHTVKSIASASNSTANTNKNNNNSSSSNKNTSSGSSGKATTSGKTNSGNKTTKSSGPQSTGSTTSGTSTPQSPASSPAAASTSMVPKEKFEAIQGKDEVYLYEGTWGEEEPYTLSFNGQDITAPMEFNAALSNVCSHQLEIDAASDSNTEYITFMHEGAFPGKAAATITVSLADGFYTCYHYNETTATFDEIGPVSVVNAMASFDVSEGGEYFITDGSAEVSTEAIEMSVDDTVDGIVPASTFESLEGKNTELVLSGETDRGVRYEIIFNGMDITSPMDFDMRIVESTEHWDDISRLAEGPLVLHFLHSGVLPGVAKVKFYANLDASVTYGLFYFNSSEVNGVYTDGVDVGDGEFSFRISHCSEYFIAEYDGENLLTASGHVGLILLILLAVILVGGGVAVFLLYRRWGKEGFLSRIHDLMAKLPGKKKPEVTAAEGEATESLEGDDNSLGDVDLEWETIPDVEGETVSAGEVASEEGETVVSEDPVAIDYATFSRDAFASPADFDPSAEAVPMDEEVVPAEEVLTEESATNDITEASAPERDYTSFMRPVEETKE